MNAYKIVSLFVSICTLIAMLIITIDQILKNIEYLSTPQWLFLIFSSLLCGFIFGINNFGDKIKGD